MTININEITNFFVIMTTISYVGPFAGYHGCMALILCLIFLFGFGLLTNTVHVKNYSTYSSIWLILFVYLCLNSILNQPKSFLYIILYSGALLVMFKKLEINEIKYIVKAFKFVSIVLAMSVLIQAYFPMMFYPFADKWFFYSNQYETMHNLGVFSHQYSGIFYEVSVSAVVLSVGCIICFVETIFKRQERVKNVLFLSILYYAVILTGKRSFMLIIPVLLLAFWIVNSIERISLIQMLGLIGLFLIFTWKLNSILEVIGNILTKGHGDTIYLSSREQYWQLALEMFKDSPVFGKGINSYDIAFNKSGIKSGVYSFAGAHNVYLQLLAETGVVGLFLYILAIFSILVTGIKEIWFLRKNNKNNKMIYNSIAVLVVITIMIYGLTGNVLYFPQQVVMLFLFLGIIINLKNLKH